MALRQHTKDCLRFGIANIAAGTNCATIINAGSGTITQASKEAVGHAVGNIGIGRGLTTKFSGNTALASNDMWRMAVACGSHTAALDIRTHQAS